MSEEPRPLRAGLDRLLHHLGAPSAQAVTSVLGRWPEMVGPTVAANAQAVALRDGVLLVAVSDPAWATQLKMLEAQILTRLDAEAPGEVRALQVRVRREPG